jgi:hypothetical protein
MGWGRYSVPVRATRVAPLSNTDPGPTCQQPGVGETWHALPVHRSGSTPASVADPKGSPWPSLSPLPIRVGSGRIYLPPFTVSSSTSSGAPPLSHCQLSDDSLGHLSIPLVGLFLVPSRSCCPRFCSHRTRALLDAGELLLLCFALPMRYGLMSVVVLCSSGANVGASSPT